MFKTGDLVYVPQSVNRFVKTSLDDEIRLDYYKSLSITKKPMLGVFRQFTDNEECLVAFPDGTWQVHSKDIYHYDGKKVIELIQIERALGTDFRLKKIYINPSHIIFISEDVKYKTLLEEGRMNLEIDKNATFSKIRLNEGQYASEIVVIGDPSTIQSKFQKKILLRG